MTARRPGPAWTFLLVATAAIGVATLSVPLLVPACRSRVPTVAVDEEAESAAMAERTLHKATFGSGCFWCTEAIFQRLRGVEAVVSGYSGGPRADPTYAEVCSGLSGHAEVVQIAYDPSVVTFDELLEAFWKSHDPTTPNQQGNDVGPQYRSVIFYHDEEQAALARRYRDELDRSGAFDAPIVTEISPFRGFYPAEEEHQNYFERNSFKPYCALVIAPKIAKFQSVFRERLKPRDSDETP